jgi:hypothetical protein
VATRLLAANNRCRNGNSEATARNQPSGDSLAAAPTLQVTVCKVWVTAGNRSPSCGLPLGANVHENVVVSKRRNGRPQQQNTSVQFTAPLGVCYSTQCKAIRHSLQITKAPHNALRFSCGPMPHRNDVAHHARAAKSSKQNQPSAANASCARPQQTRLICSESQLPPGTVEVKNRAASSAAPAFK